MMPKRRADDWMWSCTFSLNYSVAKFWKDMPKIIKKKTKLFSQNDPAMLSNTWSNNTD